MYVLIESIFVLPRFAQGVGTVGLGFEHSTPDCLKLISLHLHSRPCRPPRVRRMASYMKLVTHSIFLPYIVPILSPAADAHDMGQAHAMGPGP